MAFKFETLQVHQTAVDIADRVCVSTESFSRGDYFLADQHNHAAVSISADIAAALRSCCNRVVWGVHRRLFSWPETSLG